MRVVVQRVKAADVAVDHEITGKIGPGLLVLAGFEADDGAADLDWMAGKLVRLRLFSDHDRFGSACGRRPLAGRRHNLRDCRRRRRQRRCL